MKSSKKSVFSIITGLLLVFICSFLFAEELQVKKIIYVGKNEKAQDNIWVMDATRIK